MFYTAHSVYFRLFYITLLFFLCFSTVRAAPSFSCDKATALEKVICEDNTLSQKDRQVADFYSIAYHHAIMNDPSGLVATQRKWIRDRNKECEGGNRPVLQCLNSYYDERLLDLAINNLFSDHDQALAEISRRHPQLKNIYQAIYDFATIKNKKMRTQRVAQDMSDAFDMVSDNQVIVFNNIKDVTDAARSADNLGSVFWVISAFNYGQHFDSLRIPCEAFIKQPETIIWLEPRAGGAIDSQTPYSNCEDVMPRLKHVDALQAKAYQMQDVANEGTNRFTYGAIARGDYSALLTHSIAVLHSHDRVDLGREDKNTTAFLKDNEPESGLALAELSHHYQKYFNTPAALANTQAQHDLNLFLFFIVNPE